METFQDFLFALLTAVITAGVPVVSAYIVSSLKKAAENAKADTDNITAQTIYRGDCDGHFRRCGGDQSDLCGRIEAGR